MLDVDPLWLRDGEGTGPNPDLDAERAEYQDARYWGFKKLAPEGDRDYGNANIWAFTPDLSAFVREVGQNILDVVRSRTAMVRMRVITLEGDRLDEFKDALGWAQLEEHLKASAGSGQKHSKPLRAALDRLESENRLILLRIGEYGTYGLTGTEVTETDEEPSNFAALCRDNLNSAKRSATAGGAFGLGKAVLWRTSGLSTVLFNSDLAIPQDGRTEGRVFGRSELSFHEIDGQGYAGPGWLGRGNNGRAESYWGNRALARDLMLARDSGRSGSSILILGFDDPATDAEPDPEALADRLEKGWGEHFWPVLADGRLDVHVQTGTGGGPDDMERTAHVQAAEIEPEFVEMLEKYRSGELSETLEAEGDVALRRVVLRVPARRDGEHEEVEHEATVLVRRASDNPDDGATQPDRVAFYRSSGMLIMVPDKSKIRVGARPFHAAVLAGGAAGGGEADKVADEFLRAAEPPAHNAWELTEDVKATYARGAGACIKEFTGNAFSAIAELVGPAAGDLSDGPRGLKELLRVTTRNDEPAGPRVVAATAELDGDAWKVEATAHAPSISPSRWTAKPVVTLAGESKSGGTAEWHELTAVSNCSIDADHVLTVDAGRQKVKFMGRTAPGSHVVGADRVAISVDLRAASRVGEGDEV